MMTERQVQTLTRIDTVVSRMDLRLFGEDGESGVLARHAGKLEKLERTEAKARGVLWTVGSLFTLLASALMRHLWGGAR